ncbi:MmgE/PrpD family protein [Microbacterium pseudoresistens]|uniref:2-methylcitrate dehydratase PrpD n=1 Tax=Microbacterium pseudoresistens TaxID=640634 RepID=A0A7Y9JP24_9MICO|nr:MmgE/PrpD family protein [Microbacterium pseudoresistens]NYD54264.1 2-methylcitrate dehydratase PrpD [Microbacterium pseudoresistens]
MSAARELARAAAGVRWSGLDEPTRDNARAVFLDTLAVMAGGVARDLQSGLRRLLLAGSGDGPATVLGAARGLSVSEAVALNATLPTVLQLDEGYRLSRGHPGIHVVPVALAVGEQRGASVDEVLSALVAGYEVAARIGVAMGGTKPDIHPHGNWGAVGAAVAAAWLHSDADPAAIEAAIDIASGLAGRHDRRAAARGAGMHHLWASTGAHTGLIAGTAAAAGASAVEGALVDFLLPGSGAAPQPALLTDGLRDGSFTRFLIAENYFKLWASCGHTHTAIGAALEIAAHGPVPVEDIETVEVRTFRAASTLDARTAENALAARFSIPYVVAAALRDGRFDDDSVEDPALDALTPIAARVRVVHDESMDEGYPERGRPTTVTVHLKDGGSRSAEALLSAGDPETPATSTELEDKALRLFGSAFGQTAAREIVDRWNGLGASASITQLSGALRRAVASEGGLS